MGQGLQAQPRRALWIPVRQAGRGQRTGSASPRIQPRCPGAAAHSAVASSSTNMGPKASASLKINLFQSLPSPPGVWPSLRCAYDSPGPSGHTGHSSAGVAPGLENAGCTHSGEPEGGPTAPLLPAGRRPHGGLRVCALCRAVRMIHGHLVDTLVCSSCQSQLPSVLSGLEDTM